MTKTRLITASVLAIGMSSSAFAQSSHQHGGAPVQATSEMTKAYLETAEKMHAPMIEALKNPDPDIAFVKGMIPHHQAAIDMALVRLKYGKDPLTLKWANEIIEAQEREIKEMQAWLKKRGQ